ncbi:U-box domain-containing protein 34 [Cornus florida]|uniref:U-box domain-containing protein 34 n=1 Tax=Cornus florida TaxID=4283 RepID=UPI002897557B|nr:U-box domain-containing protein 34 [Cornus florida]
MSVDGDCPPAAMESVAVAVKGGGGGLGGSGSRRAVQWAVQNLMPKADRFVLIHVMPTITSIPTPSGDSIPIEELNTNAVSMYVEDVKVKLEEIFLPFIKMCRPRNVETVVLEGDNPAATLLRYISDSGIRSLVLGSCSSNCFTRKLKGPEVPSTVMKHAPDACDIYILSRQRLITNLADCLSTSENSSKHWLFTQRERGSRSIKNIKPEFYSSSAGCKVQTTSGASSMSNPSFLNSQALKHKSSPVHSSAVQEINHRSLGDSISEIQTIKGCPSVASISTEQSDVQAEVDQLRLELQNTVAMYNRACEDLVLAQNKVHLVSSEYLNEARRVNAAMKREETHRKNAAEEKEKHLEAVKEVEMARNLLAKEAYERQIAELKALKESLEKQKIVDALLSNDRRYKRYTREEIEIATDFFSETKMVGEGAYGKVYRCSLDHTPVAVKVLRPDASDKKEEFLREVEVLSQLRHPHMVLLLGACPESGCLVYEYMENGSLEDQIFRRSGRPSLPWFVRFRIVFEVACGLAFLHSSKPEPIVHRDLKPGNILLDRNYVSKIGDVGLAKLISDVVPDNITEYRDSILAGTLYYMDPEYQRTGTLRPKSDLYAFGIITLQLLAACHPNGLLLKVENAINNGSFSDILDRSVTDWPIAEAEELAGMALKCSGLRCRDRPDLETEVLPVLRKLADIADASIKLERNNINAPSHYFCPILQDIMDDPHIAADGFTYEHRAIKAWLERHKVSPVTKLRLQHTMLTPNHTLRSAIQEWSSRVQPQVPDL